MDKERLLNLAIVVMGVAALVTTGLVVRRELAPPPPAPRYDQPQHVPEWRNYVLEGSRVGPAAAVVTIVEFSDFQCPFCKTFAARLDSLRQAYPGEIAVVYRHYPIVEQHPHAYNAALAAECAGEQGRFEAYRGLLFEQQDQIGKTSWSDFARQAGVANIERFDRCVSGRRYASRIATDLKAGKKLDIPATPTMLINQWMVVGVPDAQKLAVLVEDARRAARNAAQGGDPTQ